MVIQRTVEKLRERPEHERAAVAGSIAIGVVVILLVGWVAIILRGIGTSASTAATNPPVAAAPAASSSSASVASASAPALEWEATASSTAAPLATTSPNTQ